MHRFDWDAFFAQRERRLAALAVLALISLAVLVLLARAVRSPTGTPAPTARPPATVEAESEPTGTATPRASPTAAASATTTSTPTPEPVTYCPFRGEEPGGPAVLLRRPILVRFGNSLSETPQTGLLQADVVVESLSEGGITRLDGLYHCQEARLVGNIRSARLINLELGAMWRAIFAYSGASQPVQQRIWDSDIYEVGAWPTERGYIRVRFRAAPHNMYTSTEAIRQEAGHKGYPIELEEPLPAWVYGDEPALEGQPADDFTVPYANGSLVSYAYEPDSGTYSRRQAGQRTVDGQTGDPVPVANVMVVWVSHTATDIIEDSLGSRSLLIDLEGRGQAMLFRDGQAHEAEWLREERDQPLILVDAQTGEPLPLKPGLTWINLVPLDLTLN